MPLVHSETIDAHCNLLLWKLTESVSELSESLGSAFISDELRSISHPQKVREWLASRLLIKILAEKFGIDYVGLHKDEHRKAYLINNDSHISITHTFDYVAVALNHISAVGIDMEKSDAKLQRTSTKYLSKPEFDHAANETAVLCMYWTAKEAVYKLYGKKKISFRDAILIEPFSKETVIVSGKLTDEQKTVHSTIHIRWHDQHCLAIAL